MSKCFAKRGRNKIAQQFTEEEDVPFMIKSRAKNMKKNLEALKDLPTN